MCRSKIRSDSVYKVISEWEVTFVYLKAIRPASSIQVDSQAWVGFERSIASLESTLVDDDLSSVTSTSYFNDCNNIPSHNRNGCVSLSLVKGCAVDGFYF